MAQTKIEWAEKVWNPVTGCSKVSEGCQNCYAERMAKRLAGRFGYPKDNPFKVTLHPDRLDEPLRWRKPSRIFVCSMGDMFHEDVPDDFIHDVLRTVFILPKHQFLVLTKRPERAKEYFSDYYAHGKFGRNLWLGVTAENQEQADKRIPILLQIPAEKRFVSIEPMLRAVDLSFTKRKDYTSGGYWFIECSACSERFNVGSPGNNTGRRYCAIHKDRWWDLHTGYQHGYNLDHIEIGNVSLCTRRIDWVILGAESGPKRRHIDYMKMVSVVQQCNDAGIPAFVKQIHNPFDGSLIKDFGLFPPELQIRQYPEVV